MRGSIVWCRRRFALASPSLQQVDEFLGAGLPLWSAIPQEAQDATRAAAGLDVGTARPYLGGCLTVPVAREYPERARLTGHTYDQPICTLPPEASGRPPGTVKSAGGVSSSLATFLTVEKHAANPTAVSPVTGQLRPRVSRESPGHGRPTNRSDYQRSSNGHFDSSLAVPLGGRPVAPCCTVISSEGVTSARANAVSCI